MSVDISRTIRLARDMGASDVHIVRGLPVRFRIDGLLKDADEHVLTDEDCDLIAKELVGDKYELISDMGELDFAATFCGEIRCRLNVFRQQRSVSAAIRILQDTIPELEELDLPPIMQTFAEYRRGIVIVTGQTGSGKSTTLASLLNRINKTRHEHIITLEDPIEYIYKPEKCTINQREIGIDTQSYSSGLRSILREDPDVTLIGEMRSLDTIETALTAAETGHLVFATLHTNSATDTIDRIVDVFPGQKQQQIRLQLSMTLQAVVAQQLLLRKSGQGRIAACEIMMPNSAIRSLIREGKSPQIMNALATSAAEGNITMDNMLIRMVKDNKITGQTAAIAAHDAPYVRKSLGLGVGTRDRQVGR